MVTRRVVTGNVDGRSVVLSDGVVPRYHEYKNVPGFSTALVWATSTPSKEVLADPISAATSYIPGKGETRLIIATFPPDSVFTSKDFDPGAAYAEQKEHLTGLVDSFDPERPGMHKTPTVDYGIVLEGPVWLELDDGVLEKLDSHSICIQQGNIHAWRNLSDKPAKIAFVLIDC